MVGSLTWDRCGEGGGDDTPWITPEDGIAIRGDAPLVAHLETDGTLFDPGYGASYAAAGEGFSPSVLHPLKSSVGSDRRSVEVDAPPPGDWSISVTVGINDTVHGVVFTSPYYFRVRILP